MTNPASPSSRWARPFALIIGIADATAGLLYLLGPDRWISGGNFALLRALPVPLSVWATLFVVAGALIVTRAVGWGGYLLGAITLTLWGLLQAVTLPTTATGGAGPVWVLALAALHYLGLWARAAPGADR